jgi:hypothetical protein
MFLICSSVNIMILLYHAFPVERTVFFSSALFVTYVSLSFTENYVGCVIVPDLLLFVILYSRDNSRDIFRNKIFV